MVVGTSVGVNSIMGWNCLDMPLMTEGLAKANHYILAVAGSYNAV
jgi:hypothetical protein